MESLEDLARKKFPDLSEAEEKVVRAAPEGTGADCSDLGGGDNPEYANGSSEAPDEKWPDARNVRADLIRWLCVDRQARELVDPRGVWIGGARITGRLDLSFTSVPFPLSLSSCRLEEVVDLTSAKMPLLSLARSWTGAISADGLKLEGDLFLYNGFHAEGEVSLRGASIGGDVDATSGTFKNPNGDALNADGIKVSGDIFLSNGFRAEGEVRLLGATIGGNLEAKRGTFINPNSSALSADGIKVGGDIFLKNGFTAAGEVRLLGAEISGQMEVERAWLDRLNLDSAHIIGIFLWQGIHGDPHPSFPSKQWKSSLDFTDAKVGSLADEQASWPEKGRLVLDGFVYDRIAAGWTDATTRLEWLHLQPDELGFRPQPYEQLIAVMRRMGYEHQVAKVAIAKQKDLRERGGLSRWGKFWSWFLYRTVRYGYEPWRAFIWMAILLLVGTISFSLARLPSVRVMVPSDKEAYQPDGKTEIVPLPSYYPEFHAFVYSIDFILPFDLGQKSHWRLRESHSGALVYWTFEVYSLFQLFAGWVLLIVAAAVPAGFIKKD